MTEQFNESSRFDGDEERMAYVVREPIVRGMIILSQADVEYK